MFLKRVPTAADRIVRNCHWMTSSETRAANTTLRGAMSGRLENNAIQRVLEQSIQVPDGSESPAEALFVLFSWRPFVRRLFCKGFPGFRPSPDFFFVVAGLPGAADWSGTVNFSSIAVGVVVVVVKHFFHWAFNGVGVVLAVVDALQIAGGPGPLRRADGL